MPRLTKTELLRELEGKLSDLQDETLSEIDYNTLRNLNNTLKSIELKLIKSNESKKQANPIIEELWEDDDVEDETVYFDENDTLSAGQTGEKTGENLEEQPTHPSLPARQAGGQAESDLSQVIIYTHNNVLSLIKTQDSLQSQLQHINQRIQNVENDIDDVKSDIGIIESNVACVENNVEIIESNVGTLEENSKKNKCNGNVRRPACRTGRQTTFSTKRFQIYRHICFNVGLGYFYDGVLCRRCTG